MTDTRIDLERRLTVETERREVAERQIHEIQVEADSRVAEARNRIRQLEELLERERTRYDDMESRLIQQAEEQKAARLKTEAQQKEESACWRKEKNQLLEQAQETHRRLAETQGRNMTLTSRQWHFKTKSKGFRATKKNCWPLVQSCRRGSANFKTWKKLFVARSVLCRNWLR